MKKVLFIFVSLLVSCSSDDSTNTCNCNERLQTSTPSSNYTEWVNESWEYLENIDCSRDGEITDSWDYAPNAFGVVVKGRKIIDCN